MRLVNTFIIVIYGVMHYSLLRPNLVAFYAKLNEYQRLNFIFRWKSRYENPQKLTQFNPRSHPRQRTAQKDTIIDTTSDSQINSNFSYRWSSGSLTFNNYFYLFLYSYIPRITINNNTPHLKSPKSQNRKAAMGRPATKLQGASVTWKKDTCGTIMPSSADFVNHIQSIFKSR